MLKGFKDFIMRGNLVELAVAFIIGAAFALVVTTFTAVLMGFIGKIGGQPDFSAVTIADVKVGDFINAVISFLIVAAVVYFFVVTPYNKLQARMARGEEATRAPTLPTVWLHPEMVANSSGRNHSAARRREAIRITEAPRPIRSRPVHATRKAGARPKRTAPSPMVPDPSARVQRGPRVSAKLPAGSAMRAKT